MRHVQIDKTLNLLDSTENKSYLGANAILGVSLACLKAAAQNEGKELYEYVSSGKVSLPMPMMNIINGGKHADSGLELQEFMIVPVVRSFKEQTYLYISNTEMTVPVEAKPASSAAEEPRQPLAGRICRPVDRNVL